MKCAILTATVLMAFTHGIRAQWTVINWPGTYQCVDSSTLYGISQDSVYFSTDEGNTWIANANGLRSFFAGDFYHGEYYFDKLYSTGTALLGSVDDGKNPAIVVRSTDRGIHWDSVKSIPPLNYALVLSGNSTNLISIISDSGNVYRSTDDGSNWLKIGKLPPVPNYIKIVEVIDTNIYAIVFSPVEVFRSQNNGITWNQVDNGFPGSGAIDFASLGSSIFISTAGGIFGPDSLFALYQTNENNSVWLPSSNALYIRDTGWQLAVGGSRIFAAMGFAGLYTSSDTGKSWAFINDLDYSEYAEISTVVTTAKNVFADYHWRHSLSDFNLSSATQPSSSNLLIAIFPNPTATTLTITAENIRRIRIFDLLGTTRFDEEYSDAENPTLDVSALPAGVYAVEVTTLSGTNVVRMVKE